MVMPLALRNSETHRLIFSKYLAVSTRLVLWMLLFFTLHVLVDPFILMKSNLQDTRNNSSDYFFTEVLSRLFYTFVLSCCTNDLPAYRRCASHPSTQLILCFMLFPDYISTALASTWYARSYFCPIESSGYMSLHINLNIDQYKISPIIFRILIRRVGLVQAVESYRLWPEGHGFESRSPRIAQARVRLATDTLP